MAGLIDNVTWIQIKTSYITTEKTCAELAEEFSVSRSSIEKRCCKERWKDIRASVCKSAEKELQEKAVEMVVEDNLARIQRVMSLADGLADKIEKALEQLDQYIIKSKNKRTQKEFDPDTGKVLAETVQENESISLADGIINTLSVQQLAAALKNIKDILITPEVNKDDDDTGVIILTEREEEPEDGEEGNLEAPAETV